MKKSLFFTVLLSSMTTVFLHGQNIGIGNATPLSKLDVLGSGADNTTSSLNIANSLGNSILFVSDDERVGIGSNVIPADRKLYVVTNPTDDYAGYFSSANVGVNTNILNAICTGVGTLDVVAVKGESVPSETYGIGGQFIGGYRGVYGSTISATAGNIGIDLRAVLGYAEGIDEDVYGISGIGQSFGSGNIYGLLGEAYGDDYAYGLYAGAFTNLYPIQQGTTIWDLVSCAGRFESNTGAGIHVYSTDYYTNNAGTDFNDPIISVAESNTGNVTGIYTIGMGGSGTGSYVSGIECNARKGTGTAQYLYGVLAYPTGTGTVDTYAGYFSGKVAVTGLLSKGGGSFKIDHPLDPENKYLYHSFVESPDMMNIYNGNITTDANGIAVVTLPTYFEALNMDFRYQLTAIGQFAQAIVFEKVVNNAFKIKTDKPNVEVSWQVTGVRKDKFAQMNRIIPEVEKEGVEKGKYLHAEAFNMPEEKDMMSVLIPRSTEKATKVTPIHPPKWSKTRK
jgi:hypothetical protein